MEEGDNGFGYFQNKYFSENFTSEEMKYWYENGCWNPFCVGDCNDPTCSKKLVILYSNKCQKSAKSSGQILSKP